MIKQQKERFKKFIFLLPRVLLVLLLMVCTSLVILGSFDQFEPYLKPLHVASMRQRQVTPALTIGPYPHEQELHRLRKEGYGVLISLLDPRLPQEKALLRLEQRTATRLGMKLISIPVSYLPIESPDNRAAAGKVGKVIGEQQGTRAYMHCYLGRHRVEYVRKELAAQGIGAGKIPETD